MSEIWQPIGVFLLLFVLLGVVLSVGMFVCKVWDHVNQPHQIKNLENVSQYNINFEKDGSSKP